MPVQKVNGGEAVKAAIREAFQSDEEHAEAHRKYTQAKSALTGARKVLEAATSTLDEVEAEAKETAVKRELGEATDGDVADILKAVDAARAELSEAKDLVEIRESAANILKDRFEDARDAARRRLNREWGQTYREAVERLVEAYRAFEAANDAVKQIEYDVQLRTLKLPHMKASWPEPVIQPGGEPASTWISKLKQLNYQTNGE